MTARSGHNLRDAPRLTPREVSVLMLVAEGWTNKSVAGRLGISRKTVETYVHRLYRKILGEDLDDGKSHRVEIAVRYWRWVREATDSAGAG